MIAPKAGFTIIEVMIVAAIIGVLAMICIPNFLQSRIESHKKACIDNLRKIEGAVEQAKIAGILAPGSSVLFGTGGYLKAPPPKCPSTKAVYTAFDPPVCPSGDSTHVSN